MSKKDKLNRALDGMSDKAKKKKEKRKRYKKNRPRGYFTKRLGFFTAWFLFGFVLLYVFVNVAFGGSVIEDTPDVIAEESKITSYEAIDFGKDFLYEFYNISKDSDEQDLRSDRLGNFVSNLVNTDVRTPSDKVSLSREDILVKEVDKIDEENVRITYSITLNVVSTQTIEVETEDKDGEKETELVDEEHEDTATIHVSVPIQLTSNGTKFIVSQQPSFVYLENTPEDKSATNLLSELQKMNEGDETDNAEAFLSKTFFSWFSNESKEQLSYVLEDKKYSLGLSKTMEFKELEKVTFYKGKDDKEFIADVNAIFIEPISQMEIESNYLLVIRQKGEQLVVKEINNDDYVLDIIHKKDVVENEESDTDENSDINNTNGNNQENDGSSSEENEE